MKGDGTPYRSYLYAADLIIWLWTILSRGESCRAYNVGSEEAITIAELARKVANCFQNSPEVQIATEAVLDKSPDRYVPSTKRAQDELGLGHIVGLETALERTIAHYSCITKK